LILTDVTPDISGNRFQHSNEANNFNAWMCAQSSWRILASIRCMRSDNGMYSIGA
jgi:hypothetical protein